MARTLCTGRKRIPPPPARQRRILVASLLIHNPTTAEQGGDTDDTFAVEREPTAGLPKRRRTRSRHVAAAPLDLPEEILAWEIFVRLPAKDILRCRAVCHSWHRLTIAPDFLHAHHRHQPSLPLVTLYDKTGRGGRSPFGDRGRPVLGFDDYKGFKLHASCDGLLLLSLSDGRYSICNPATRQCAPLSCLATAGNINIAALYLHHPSGEYRVLYWKGRQLYHLKPAYYILMVRRGRSPRCIGVPSYTSPIEKFTLAMYGMPPTNSSPPIMFHNCLHWHTGFLPNFTKIVVFDTVVESFRFMRRPDGATRFCAHLCDMEGSIGFSCLDNGSTAAKIWVLDDYEREVWSLKYHVKFPVERLRNLQDKRHLILSHKGDVLVYSQSKGYMFHYNNTGKLIEEFRCDPWSLSIMGHLFKESLVKQDISLRRGCGCVKQLRFFTRI